MTDLFQETSKQLDAIGHALMTDDLSQLPESNHACRESPPDHRLVIQGQDCGVWLDSKYSFRTLIEALDAEVQIQSSNWPGRKPGTGGPGVTRICRIKGRGAR